MVQKKKTKVLLAGMGPYTEEILNAEHHIDTFSIMRKAIDGLTEPVGEGFYEGYPPFPVYGWVLISVAIVSIPLSFFIIRRRKIIKSTN